MNDVSGTEEFWSGFFYMLKNGEDFLTTELLSAAGFKESTYDTYKKEMAYALIKEYMAHESYVTDKASEVSGEFKQVKRTYDLTSSIDRALFAKDLKACSGTLTEEQISEIVDWFKSI